MTEQNESNKQNLIEYVFNKATILVYLPFLIAFFLDKFTKNLVIEKMPITVDVATTTFSSYPPYELLSWLWIRHVVNFGIAFSMFYGKTYLLIGLVSIISAGLIIYERSTYKKRPHLVSISLGLILAGALGNLTDRIARGYVTDFLAFMHNGNYIWPIFNVADMCVDIGVGLFIIDFLIEEFFKKKDKSP